MRVQDGNEATNGWIAEFISDPDFLCQVVCCNKNL